MRKKAKSQSLYVGLSSTFFFALHFSTILVANNSKAFKWKEYSLRKVCEWIPPPTVRIVCLNDTTWYIYYSLCLCSNFEFDILVSLKNNKHSLHK